ncbi:MAG: hypothetical protein ACLFV4_07125 [Candidatus Hydrogenedentota bacterium]
MRNNLRGNKGYALIEAIAYIGVLTVVINLAAGAFLNQHRLNIAGMEALDRIREMDRLSNDVRGLIRRAGAVLPEGAGWSASEELLVLALPPEGEGRGRSAVLGVLGEDGRFGWMIIEDGAAVRAASYRLDFEQVRVSLDADEWPEVRQVTFEFTPAYAFGEKREPMPRYVTGALRNAGAGGES